MLARVPASKRKAGPIDRREWILSEDALASKLYHPRLPVSDDEEGVTVETASYDGFRADHRRDLQVIARVADIRPAQSICIRRWMDLENSSPYRQTMIYSSTSSCLPRHSHRKRRQKRESKIRARKAQKGMAFHQIDFVYSRKRQKDNPSSLGVEPRTYEYHLDQILTAHRNYHCATKNPMLKIVQANIDSQIHIRLRVRAGIKKAPCARRK